MPPWPAEDVLPCSSAADPMSLNSSKYFFPYKKSRKSYNYWQPSVSIHGTLANAICRWGHHFYLCTDCALQPACFAHLCRPGRSAMSRFSYPFTVIVCAVVLFSELNKH